MSAKPSNLRVDVVFQNPVVFAGEKLSAVITFRNIAPVKPGISIMESQSSTTAATGEPQEERRNSESGRRFSMSLRNSLRGLYLEGGPSTSASSTPSVISRSATITKKPSSSGESLLMGFAQLQGFFRVDKTIVDSSAFDHIKTQGVVVGVHGLEYGNQHQNKGLLWGITSGIGELLGGGPDGTPSSPVADIKRSGFDDDGMGSDDFPIFSTPQSLLFVDLKLAPGQARSFSYQIELPDTLPPSFKGKALRINYNLVIGAQKLGLRGNPVPKIIFLPFRVFPYVDESGNQTSHDIEMPIVLKSDTAVVNSVQDRRPSSKLFDFTGPKKMSSPSEITKSREDFSQYVAKLMKHNEGAVDDAESHLPFALLRKRSSVSIPGSEADDQSIKLPARENIDFIAKYNFAHMSLKTNFDVAKQGSLIATASLSKPIYRIGEDVTLLIDLSKSRQNFACHHVTASLEANETIKEDLLQPGGKQSEQERRIYSQQQQSTFCLSKAHFELTIPPTASPEFKTSLSTFSWCLKLEFVITLLPESVSAETRTSEPLNPLIQAEPVGPHDDKGQFFFAKKALVCERVTCRIPLRVLPTNQDIGAIIDHALHSRKWAF